MFPVAALAGAGWLLLFIVLLTAPPSPGPHEGGGPGEGGGDPGDEPPAVVSLLAGRLAKLGFGATLVDLAARGWFEVRTPAGPAGQAAWGPGAPVMCVVAAEAPFAPAGTNTAWSSYSGGWQQIEIETSTWPWPRSCVILLAIIFGPVLYFTAAIWLGTHGMAVLAEELVALVVVAAIAGVGIWLARRTLFASFAEFDGQVIRQWMVTGDESPDQYHVAIDDGTRAKAWDLEIGSEPYRLLPPGTFVHARVNLRNREQVTVEPVEPPAGAARGSWAGAVIEARTGLRSE